MKEQQAALSRAASAWSHRPPGRSFAPLSFVSLTAVLLGIAAVAGWGIATYGLTYRTFIVAAGVLAAGRVALMGNRALQAGFALWLCTLALGYRTIEISEHFRLQVSEVFLYVLFGIVMVACVRRPALLRAVAIPKWLILFAVFWIWGWSPFISPNVSWDVKLNEFRCFLLLIPLWVCTRAAITNRTDMRRAITWFVSMSVVIAAVGIAEAVFPSVKNFTPGLFSNTEAIVTDEGFERATFSFWGSQDAIFSCILALPFCFAFLTNVSDKKRVLVVGVSILLLVGAIYVSGHRNGWLLVLLQLALWTIMSRKPLVWLGVPLLLFTVYLRLPEAAHVRAEHIVQVLGGARVDSSTAKRWDRNLNAWATATTEPWGHGWGAAGWVHNDYLQIAVNLGVPAALYFLFIYGRLLRDLYRKWLRNRSERELSREWSAFFISALTLAGLWALDCTITLPQLVLPGWFIWMLSLQALRLSPPVSGRRDLDAKDHSTRPLLQ